MNFVVCEYCNFVTEKQPSMDRHNKTDKHIKNTSKNYIELSDKNEIIKMHLKKKQKKLLTQNSEVDDYVPILKLASKQNKNLFPN